MSIIIALLVVTLRFSYARRLNYRPKSVQYSLTRSESVLFILSAHSKHSLFAYARDLGHYLLSTDSKYLAVDVAFTLAKRSKRHRFQWTTVESELSHSIETLRTGIENTFYEVLEKRKVVVLVFAG